MSKPTSLLFGLCGAALLALGGCSRDEDERPADESLEAIESAISGERADARPDEPTLAAAGTEAGSGAGTASATDATAPEAGELAATAAPDAEVVAGASETAAEAAPALGAALPAGERASDALPPDTRGDDRSLAPLVDEGEIPYPVYPNGSKYRVGGENGLMIVLYETTDSFDEVDAYYRARSGEAGMPRLAGMSDYVRYGASLDDNDPWATHRPGIVIHRFADEGEREAVGAGESARTNIIISY